MDVVLTDEIRTARKPHKCDSYAFWYRCGWGPEECETADQRLILEAVIADKGMILPGRKYHYQSGVHEGRMVSWRERIDMGKLCTELNAWAVRT